MRLKTNLDDYGPASTGSTGPASPSRHTRARVLLLVAGLLICACAAPATAFGQRLPTDFVGDRTLAQIPSLTASAPNIIAPEGILETADGRVLWARKPDGERAMASTTKIMTAVVVLAHSKLSEEATVSTAAVAVESGAPLTAGEKLTVRDLLGALLVKSANDAANVLAEHVGGSVKGFVAMMNAEAKSLGLAHTHYANTHGLDAPGHHTSAADLAALARHAMKDPTFRSIVAKRSVVIPAPRGHLTLKSTDNLLGSYPGMEGVKTGFTDDAGYCLVSAAKQDGVELFGVILGTRDESARFTQTRRLLDWGFAHYRARTVISAGTTVGVLPVTDYLDRDVGVRVAETTAAVYFDLAGPVTRHYDLRPSAAAPVAAGQVLGTVTASQGGRVLARLPLVAINDVPEPGFWERGRIFLVRTWQAVFGPRGSRGARVTTSDQTL